jgi:uncharacterized protein YcbK (DUF882 family)
MDEEFMSLLESLRVECAFPFVINSGYRCASRNAEVGGAPGSYHLLGRAVDIRCYDRRAFEIVKKAEDFGFNGIRPNLKGDHLGRFVHLDNREGFHFGTY